jgi:hypothetical protein
VQDEIAIVAGIGAAFPFDPCVRRIAKLRLNLMARAPDVLDRRSRHHIRGEMESSL